MSTKIKSAKQSKQSEADIANCLGQHFAHGDEQENRLTIDTYLRVSRFATGEADHGDRQTLRIRLCAASYLLETFDYNPVAEAVLIRALEIVDGYRPQIKRDLRKVDVGSMSTLRRAFILFDEMVEQSSYWLQVQAHKHGEDICLIDAANYEYSLITVH